MPFDRHDRHQLWRQPKHSLWAGTSPIIRCANYYHVRAIRSKKEWFLHELQLARFAFEFLASASIKRPGMLYGRSKNEVPHKDKMICRNVMHWSICTDAKQSVAITSCPSYMRKTCWKQVHSDLLNEYIDYISGNIYQNGLKFSHYPFQIMSIMNQTRHPKNPNFLGF